MCGCEPFYVCSRCRGRWPFDPDRMLEQDPRERELELRDRDLSAVSFREPFQDAA